MTMRAFLWVAVALTVGSAVAAQDASLTEGQADVSIMLNGQQIVISRSQDTDAMLTGEFAKTSRPCPSFCIQPVIPVAGVTPAGELEVIEFLQKNMPTTRAFLLMRGFQTGSTKVPFRVP